MTDRVAVRDAPRTHLTVWHDCDADGRPACRHGQKSDCTYRVLEKETLPDGVTQCAYCAGEYTTNSGLRPDTLAHKLVTADPKEVISE